MLKQGREDGTVRHAVRMPDVVFAVIRFSRPVALGLSPADDRALAHRALDIYNDGFGTARFTRRPWSEPPVLERWNR